MYRKLPHVAVPGYGPICMDTNDPFTVECAFKKRLMRNIPPCSRVDMASFGRFVDSWIRSNVNPVVPLGFEEWLASTSYNEERKGELRLAYDLLRGGLPVKSQCQSVATFVKSEFYDLWKHCRLINSRSDSFKVFSGPLIKAIEIEVYKHPAFVKHVPVPDRPGMVDALRKSGRRYISSDFKAFESHFTAQLMDACELRLYRYCLVGCATSVVDTLCNSLKGLNKMRLRNGIKADVRARRMSGDMCTSLGNGFTNLMLALYLAECGGYLIDGYVEGDDGLFAVSGCPSCWLPTDTPAECGLVSAYNKLGFTIEIEEHADPRRASFCGMIFGPSGAIIRDPRHFARGFGWTQSFIRGGPVIMHELLRAKALSACYETPQCPVVGAMARYALLKTEGYAARFVSDGYHKGPPDQWKVEPFDPSEDTRELFAQLYHISVADQVEVEKLILSGDMSRIAEFLPPTADDVMYVSRYIVTD